MVIQFRLNSCPFIDFKQLYITFQFFPYCNVPSVYKYYVSRLFSKGYHINIIFNYSYICFLNLYIF